MIDSIYNANTKKYLLDLLAFCKKIKPYVTYFKRQIKSYNNTSHNILKYRIDLTLPQTIRKQKCGNITTIVSSFLGLAYEDISSFYTTKETKLYIKQLRLWIAKQQSSATN